MPRFQCHHIQGLAWRRRTRREALSIVSVIGQRSTYAELREKGHYMNTCLLHWHIGTGRSKSICRKTELDWREKMPPLSTFKVRLVKWIQFVSRSELSQYHELLDCQELPLLMLSQAWSLIISLCPYGGSMLAGYLSRESKGKLPFLVDSPPIITLMR